LSYLGPYLATKRSRAASASFRFSAS